GAVAAEIALIAGRGAPNRISADLDFEAAALSISELDWSKPEGVPATGRVEAVATDGVLLDAPTLALSAPGLSFSGAFSPGGAPGSGRLTVQALRVGRTAFDQLDVRFDPESVMLLGRASGFDLSPLRRAEPGDDAEAANPLDVSFTSPVAVDARLAVDRLWLDPDAPPMTDVALTMSHDGARWRAATFEGAAGAGSLALDYAVGREGADLAVRIDDVGAAVAAIGGAPRVRGGRLAATADPGEGGGVGGRVDIRDLRLVNAPIMARALQIASLTGVLETLGGSGLLFGAAGAYWALDDGILTLEDGRARNVSLGLTFNGEVDLVRERVAMRGTLAPAFLLSRAIGAIPLIGDILSPRDEGLFAFSYQATGPIAGPEVSVNPLTALAPGVLRDLFPDSETELDREDAPTVNEAPEAA
ncbi:MAG: AsmA-like C-terminal region-containing protein, partial [Pseudomonadota bacterium]